MTSDNSFLPLVSYYLTQGVIKTTERITLCDIGISAAVPGKG